MDEFPRRAMEPRHSPAYVAQIGREWRVVVPIRGKLSPKLATTTFLARAEAEIWLRSADGQLAIARLRERPQPVRVGLALQAAAATSALTAAA